MNAESGSSFSLLHDQRQRKKPAHLVIKCLHQFIGKIKVPRSTPKSKYSLFLFMEKIYFYGWRACVILKLFHLMAVSWTRPVAANFVCIIILIFFLYRINFYPIIWGKVKNLQWGNPDHVDLDVPGDGVTWSDELSYVFVLSTKEGSPWHGRFAAIAFHV